jgi:hypothetical protein
MQAVWIADILPLEDGPEDIPKPETKPNTDDNDAPTNPAPNRLQPAMAQLLPCLYCCQACGHSVCKN